MKAIKNYLSLLLLLVLTLNGCGGGTSSNDPTNQTKSPNPISLGNTLNYSAEIPASLKIVSEGIASYTVDGLILVTLI